jgi:hypothetical protein
MKGPLYLKNGNFQFRDRKEMSGHHRDGRRQV